MKQAEITRTRTAYANERIENTAVPKNSPPLQPGILVVDDEELISVMLRIGLTRHGFRVFLAADGNEAMRIYRKHESEIDIVLLDVCMPGLDGPNVFAALRGQNPDLKACFMTGESGIYDREDLLQLGAICVFDKPFHILELADTFRRILRGTKDEFELEMVGTLESK